MQYLKMADLDLSGQTVLIREDLNVPLQDGVIVDDTRIRAALPTIKLALAQNAAVILLSHLGRPAEGEYDAQFSLAPVAAALGDALQCDVPLVKDWLLGVDVKPGQVVLCENVRFNKGEKNNDTQLSQQMANLCEVFVMDAFATAHRAQASTAGVAEYAPIACAGPLLDAELQALGQALQQPAKPVVAVVGGSKVSTKISVLENLLDKVDTLIVGGGIANTLLAATGVNVGASLYEQDWLERSQQLLKDAAQKNVQIPLPVDVLVAKTFSPDADAVVKSLEAIEPDDMILDVGPQTAATYPALMQNASTIVWNGPVGVFEFAQFSQGTQALGKAIAASAAFSIAGGGDTLAALAKFELADKITYISTGGGAFLEFMEGKALPAVVILEQRAKNYE